MAVTAYSKSSPYYTTKIFDDKFLDVLSYRTIERRPEDIQTTIAATYHLRPDLMAYDLYGTSALWWVFAARNPNALPDPLWSFTEGTQIYLPQRKYLTSSLGN